MDYSVMDKCMQALFEQNLPLSPAQSRRLSQFCTCVLLAGSSQLPKLARWLGREAKQDYREQWLRRLLDARFVNQELLYDAWFKQVLAGYQSSVWHVIIDRTNLVSHEVDLVKVALAYRKRAIPIGWQQIPYGGASAMTYINLLNRIKSRIPAQVSVVFHGDAEFGAIPILTYVREQGWDFILGQRCHYQCRPAGAQNWQALDSFAMTKRQGLYLSNITLTKTYEYRPVNLFGFMQKGKKSILEKRFFATSLPTAHTLRRIGKRRWGIECCFQDYKSSGWHIDTSHLQAADARERLLVILSTCYLWVTCLGRWLCKTGQRGLVDTHPQRQLSLFRIGWDWLVYQFRQQQPIPHLLTLYS